MVTKALPAAVLAPLGAIGDVRVSDLDCPLDRVRLLQSAVPAGDPRSPHSVREGRP